MSKSNLARVNPTTMEIAKLGWTKPPQEFYDALSRNREAERTILRRLHAIWADVPKLPRMWQMPLDVNIPPSSPAEMDSTIIPFWYGTQPQKVTWLQRLVGWFKS
jgi:hypothetical protein